MNQNEALDFLKASVPNELGKPAQLESLTPDEVGTQLVPQVRAAGMSQEDALSFLGVTPKKKSESVDSDYLTSPIPAAQLPPSDPNNLTSNYTQSVPQPTPQTSQGISKEDALAFLGASPAEQTAAPINLPAMPGYENYFRQAAAQTSAGLIRQAEGLERASAAPLPTLPQLTPELGPGIGGTKEEATSAFDQAIADRQSALTSLQNTIAKKGFTTADDTMRLNAIKDEISKIQSQKPIALASEEYTPEAQQQLLERRKAASAEASQLEQQAQGMFPYFGVSPTDTSLSAQLGRGTGSVFSMAPAIVGGLVAPEIALPAMVLQGGSEAYSSGYNNHVQELKQQGVTDQKTLDIEGHKAGSAEAIHSVPVLAAYAVGGVLPAKVTGALMKGASPLVRGLVGGTTAAGVNLGISGTMRAMQGQNFLPNVEQAVPDLAFGGIAAFHAGMAPSENPVVNQREAEIIGKANAQKDVPLTPDQEKVNQQWQVLKKQATDVANQLAELPEDHPDRPALQQKAQNIANQMADLRAGKPVDIKTEQPQGDERFQPKPENAVQVETTGEVGVRNTPAVGEGVGEQNKPEEVTPQGEKPKEEVAPNTLSEEEAQDPIAKLNKSTPQKDGSNLFEPATQEEIDEQKKNPVFILADKLAGIFGKKVVLYRAKEGRVINGAVNRGMKEYIFLNVDGSRPHLFTAGHELWHSIEVNSPELYKSLRKELEALVKDRAGLEAKYRPAGYRPERYVDEHIGDLLGDALQDPDFWNKLADRNPEAFKSLAEKTIDWLNSVIDKLKGWAMGGGEHTRDLEKARNMLADGLNNFAKGKDEPVAYPPETPSETFYQQEAEKVDEKYSQLEKNYKNGDESAKKEAEKILDEKALRSKPYVIGPIYHWSKTNNAFRVFDISKGREGFHFGTEGAANQVRVAQRKAERWGEPKVKGEDYKVYIMSDHKPIRITDSELNNATSIAYQLNEKGLLNENQYRIIEDADKKLDLEKNLVIYPNINKFKTDVSTREKSLGRDLKHPFDELTAALGYKPVFEYKNNAEDKGSLSYIATDSSQIKSAEPFTYDEQGKLIPISERFNPEKEDIYFQQEAERKPDKDGFYSQLQRTLSDKMPNKASVEQIRAIIDPAKGSGVKPDELKWSNLEGFLEGKKNVTKQEVLDYLKNEGAVKFEERTLGGKLQYNEESEFLKKFPEIKDIYRQSRSAEDFRLALDNSPSLYNSLRNRGYKELADDPAFAYKIASDIFTHEPLPTKYSQYTLPNGENYREVVLTMPFDKSKSEAKMAELNKKYNDFMAGINPVEMLKLKDSDPEAYKKIEDEMKSLDDQRKQLQNDFLSGKTGEQYTSHHFQDIPNYVAHMRLDERPDSEGRNGLFIEEIQSDRHQQGREKGYVGEEKYKTLPDGYQSHVEKIGPYERWWVTAPDGKQFTSTSYSKESAESQAINRLNDEARGTSGSPIPDAPFRKDWSVQMFKRALRDAIASGKEWVGWTKGDTQAERYDLSKQVEAILPTKNADGTYTLDALKKGSEDGVISVAKNIDESKLADYVGKDIAKQIIEAKLEAGEDMEIAGDNLKIGGEGMKGFYDQILPKEIAKYVKKWGAKVEEGEVGSEYYKIYDPTGKLIETHDTKAEAMKALRGYDEGYTASVSGEPKTQIWKVEITPEMRESVSNEGQTMFQQERPTEQEASKKREEIDNLYSSAPIKKTKRTIVNTFKRSPAKEAISYMRDAGDNAANVYAKQQTNEVGNDLKREFKKQKDKASEALSFVIESKRDPKALDDMRQKLNASTDASPKWKKKALDAIDFAEKNYARLEPIADKYEQIGLHQVAQENANGIDTPVREGYVPHYQDLDEQELFGGAGAGSATGFRKMRVHDTFADSIAAGVDPKSLSATDLLQKRLSSGQKSINYRSWIDSLKGTIDPASGDPIATKISIVKRPDGSSYLDVPKGYHQETLAGQRVAIKDGYEGIIGALTDPSAWQKNLVGQTIQKTSALGKSITLGLDTYHLGRIAIWNSLIKSLGLSTFKVPLPSYRKGATLLDQTLPELQKMIASGEIPKSYAKGILENKRLLNLAVKTGYNVGGISDALHQDWVHSIPALGDFNSWLFNSFQRGAMAESWLLEFQRYRNAYRHLPEEQVARMVSKDLNTRYGNLGRQGILKSKTAQDTARFLFLAPQWNEGLIRTELGALGQSGQALLDAATGKRLFAGVLARSVGGMMAAQFIANQLINYATRGTPTWENPEEGIGAKISAYIPDLIGNGPGFFLNPMSLAMETTHLLMKGYERTGSALETAKNYFRSRSSTTMRPVWSALTNKNALGSNYAPGQIWKGMLQDTIPMPIAAGAIYSSAKQAMTGEPSEQFAGQYQKQLFSTFGIKLEQAPSDESRMYTLMNHYKLDNNIEDRSAGYNSPYSELNHALMIGNQTTAKDAMTKLMETRTPEQISKYYKNTYPQMRVLESKNQMKDFLNTLNEEQMSVYDRAKERRKDTSQKALDLLRDMQ